MKKDLQYAVHMIRQINNLARVEFKKKRIYSSVKKSLWRYILDIFNHNPTQYEYDIYFTIMGDKTIRKFGNEVRQMKHRYCCTLDYKDARGFKAVLDERLEKNAYIRCH